MSEQATDIKFFFPTVVQETMVENHDELNCSLLPAIAHLRATTPGTVPGSWSCELYTTLVTSGMLHRAPEFTPLIHHIEVNAERFAKFLHFDLEHYRLSIVNCWVNVYAAHHAQDVHNHSNCLISGVYYVRVPRGSPGLLIRSPVEDTMLHPPLTQPSFANAVHHEVQAVEGKMVLFRSFLKHSVRPHPVEGERISIAFNLTV